MQLTKNETELLSDMQADTFEVWELYNYTRTNYPQMSEKEIVRYVRELLSSWLNRGWLKAYKSREGTDSLSEEAFLAEIDRLGMDAANPEKSRMALDLTKRVADDVEWLRKLASPRVV